MRVHVEPERCQGHALCWMATPDVFDLSEEDGRAHATPAEVPAALEETVRRAALNCPERAIVVDD